MVPGLLGGACYCRGIKIEGKYVDIGSPIMARKLIEYCRTRSGRDGLSGLIELAKREAPKLYNKHPKLDKSEISLLEGLFSPGKK